ncbi:ureidoglycolate lyase [Paraburkholderia sp. IMGN_8]|uniref:ureidoglycolate lyase n=1 Tax=Paraburkholderia sp. IMGN_8 TaxID=3136564 RepID=UPI003101AB60
MTTAGAAPYIEVKPLSANAFDVYGEVLENKTEQRRRDFSMPFAGLDTGTTPRLWINRLQPSRTRSIAIDTMECHPHSHQTFIPMREVPYLIAVALPGEDGLPDLATLSAFISGGGQGVCYRRSVWHFAFTSLDDVNEVAVIMAESGRSDDTVVTRLAEPVMVAL